MATAHSAVKRSDVQLGAGSRLVEFSVSSVDKSNQRQRLLIRVAAGVGEGPNPLAAFDAALLAAGVANFNLIHLSSVIPPGSVVERGTFVTAPDQYGHRLYLVMARRDEDKVGAEAWAGLGWTQEARTGRGLFVEVDGPSRVAVCRDLETTLSVMMSRRAYDFGPIQSEVVGIGCHGRAVCALVLAVYRSEGWSDA